MEDSAKRLWMKEKKEIIIINIIFTYGTVQLREIIMIIMIISVRKTQAARLYSCYFQKNAEFPSNVISWSAICA